MLGEYPLLWSSAAAKRRRRRTLLARGKALGQEILSLIQPSSVVAGSASDGIGRDVAQGSTISRGAILARRCL